MSSINPMGNHNFHYHSGPGEQESTIRQDAIQCQQDYINRPTREQFEDHINKFEADLQTFKGSSQEDLLKQLDLYKEGMESLFTNQPIYDAINKFRQLDGQRLTDYAEYQRLTEKRDTFPLASKDWNDYNNLASQKFQTYTADQRPAEAAKEAMQNIDPTFMGTEDELNHYGNLLNVANQQVPDAIDQLLQATAAWN